MTSATVALLLIYVLYKCFLEQKMVNKICELSESGLEYKHKMVESSLKSRIYSFTKEDVFSIQRRNIYSDFFSPILNYATVFRSSFYQFCSPYKV